MGIFEDHESRFIEIEDEFLKDFPEEVLINLSLKDLKFYHQGIFLLQQEDKTNNFASHKFRWRRYCSHYDHIHLTQLFQTQFNIKCDITFFQ